MSKYTLTKCNKLGEPDEKYGQSYWGEVMENEKPVMFSTHKEISVGDKIGFEAMKPKTSKKGNEYFWLTGVKVVGKIEKQGSESSGDLLELVKENNKMLRQLTGVEEEPPIEAYEDDEPVTLEDMGDEVSLDQIPF